MLYLAITGKRPRSKVLRIPTGYNPVEPQLSKRNAVKFILAIPIENKVFE
jgi:hypothetical protein